MVRRLARAEKPADVAFTPRLPHLPHAYPTRVPPTHLRKRSTLQPTATARRGPTWRAPPSRSQTPPRCLSWHAGAHARAQRQALTQQPALPDCFAAVGQRRQGGGCEEDRGRDQGRPEHQDRGPDQAPGDGAAGQDPHAREGAQQCAHAPVVHAQGGWAERR